MTIGFWVTAIFVAIVGVGLGLLIGIYDYEWGKGTAISVAGIIIAVFDIVFSLYF